MGDRVHEALQRLIRAGARRIEWLEILLLMVRTPGATWEPAGVAAASMLAVDPAAAALDQLRRSGLLELVDPERPAYRLAAGAPIDDLVELRRVYERDRARVTTEFFACNLDNLRDFANAFKLRRSD
jgi:hypothetical protein